MCLVGADSVIIFVFCLLHAKKEFSLCFFVVHMCAQMGKLKQPTQQQHQSRKHSRLAKCNNATYIFSRKQRSTYKYSNMSYEIDLWTNENNHKPGSACYNISLCILAICFGQRALLRGLTANLFTES